MFKALYVWARLRNRVETARRDFPVYVRRIRLNPDFGRIDSAPAIEIEHPYREGTACVIRVFGTFGVTIGVMNNHTDQSDKAINQRLLKALTGADGGRDYWDTPEADKAVSDQAEAVEEDPDKAWLKSIGILGLEDTVEPEE